MWTTIVASIIGILTSAAETTISWISGDNAIEAQEKAAIEAINTEKDATISTIKQKISNQNTLVVFGSITLIIIVIILTSKED